MAFVKSSTKATKCDEASLALVHVDKPQVAPIVSSYNERNTSTGISLPRGQGICTRLPLAMRLQNHPQPKPELVLEQLVESNMNSTESEEFIWRIGRNILSTRLRLISKGVQCPANCVACNENDEESMQCQRKKCAMLAAHTFVAKKC
ncbi:hypothetical protein TSUD_57790 [Trifolium subterraneum]|uniref:Uncharacterized protein n=1 Tax=Trifolium subterraneum TaxID=3900 RepID=A0A2Z6MF20_TRISU|nr:hypothetical protein TSUD_57790 [Trifolium subterraneum]